MFQKTESPFNTVHIKHIYKISLDEPAILIKLRFSTHENGHRRKCTDFAGQVNSVLNIYGCGRCSDDGAHMQSTTQKQEMIQ